MKYLVMAGLLMAGVAVNAQEPQQPQLAKQQFTKAPVERLTPAQKADKLAADLGLTADQKTKVTAIYEEQETKANELRGKYKGQRDEATRKAFVDEVKANRELFNEKMKSALTDEQYAKWKEQGADKRGKAMTMGKNKTLQAAPKTKE